MKTGFDAWLMMDEINFLFVLDRKLLQPLKCSLL